MKRLIPYCTLFGFALMALGGCTLFQQPPAPEPLSEPEPIPEFRSSEPDDSENPYFLFTEAQLQWNRNNSDKAIKLMESAVKADPSDFLKRELAYMLVESNQEDRALSILENIVHIRPDDAESWAMIGDIRQKQDQPQEAIAAYRKSLEIDPDQESLYHIVGEMYMDAEQPEEAMQNYSRLAERFPGSYVAHFFLGKLYARKGDLPSAEAEFRRTIDLDPSLEEPWIQLMSIYEKSSRLADLTRTGERFLARNPRNIRARLILADIHQKTGRQDNAREIYLDLAKESAENPEIVKTLVTHYLEPQRFQELLPIVEIMLTGASDVSPLHYLSAITYEAMNNQDQAIFHYLRVAPDSRFFENAVMHAMYLLQDTGKTEEALTAIRDAIQYAPTVADFRLYLAVVLEQAGRYEPAAAAMREGIQLDPENDQYFFRLGVIYDKWGKKEEAIEAMKTSVRLNPENPSSLNYLGYTYADMGQNLDEAEKLILDAMHYQPNDGYITDSLGWVYYQKGEYERALYWLQKAVELVPDDGAILEHLGDVYWKLNNFEKALEMFHQALEHNPPTPEAVREKIRKLKNREK
jgi:tetratricopeptide (TPR) repeat protein